MAGIEKAIKGLECCLAVKNAGTQTCFDCPYRELDGKENVSCEDWLMDDAIDILKEQEDALEQMRLDNTDLRNCNAELMKAQKAKPPVIMQDIEGIWSTCSMCGHKLRPILAMKRDTYFPKFCSECGQAVKWE